MCICVFVAMFDRDQSGTIELHEFQGLWNYLSQWRTLFDQFDRDRSGTIDAGELTTGSWSSMYILRDSTKSRQKMVKTRQTFVRIAKITAKTRHQITGLKTIIQSIKLNI